MIASGSRRLTIVSGAWKPVEGGAERQLREVATALAGLGWAVTVVAGGRDAQPLLADAPLKVIRLTTPRGQLPTGAPMMARAAVVAARSRPDVLLGSLVGAAPMAAVLAGGLLRVPTAIRIGGEDFRLDSRARRAQARMLVLGADAIVANAPHLLETVRSIGPRSNTKLATIRNGVAPFDDAPVPVVRSGPTRVLYYTNGNPAKNEDDFLTLVKSCPEVRFRALGSTMHLVDLLPNLDAMGWVEDVGANLEWADAVVNTSFTEGSPNFCLQALAARRPVVGFANAGMVDLAEAWPNDVTTVLMRDVAGVANILRFTDLRHHIVTASPTGIREVAQEWDSLLRSLIQDR